MKLFAKASEKVPARETLTEAYEVRAFRDEGEAPVRRNRSLLRFFMRSRGSSRRSRAWPRDMASRPCCPMIVSSATMTCVPLSHKGSGAQLSEVIEEGVCVFFLLTFSKPDIA
jgi:hypothetical protein